MTCCAYPARTLRGETCRIALTRAQRYINDLEAGETRHFRLDTQALAPDIEQTRLDRFEKLEDRLNRCTRSPSFFWRLEKSG